MPRDVAGNYTLPTGNPVIAHETIEANWANTTMPDIAAALTESLSRSGHGGMLVPFRFIDGSLSAPGITFANEPTSGIYRAGLNDLRFSVGAQDVLQITQAGITLPVGKTLTGGAFTITGGSINGTVIGNTTPAAGTFTTLTSSGIAPSAAIFAGAGGLLSGDATKFVWDNTNKRLGVGTAAPAVTLDVAGQAQLANAINFLNNNVAPANVGIYRGANVIQVRGDTGGFTVNNSANTLVNFSVSDAGAVVARTSFASPSVISSTGSLALGASNAQLWNILGSGPAGQFYPQADNAYLFGGPGNRINTVYTTIVDSGVGSSLLLRTGNGQTGFEVAFNGTAVNWLKTFPSPLGSNFVQLSATGSDANIAFYSDTKGSGSHIFRTDVPATNVVQLQILHTANANRNITITGSNGGNPTIGTTAGSINFSAPVTFASGFAPNFESAEQNIAASVDTFVAHGLGARPRLFRVYLRCKTAELGYAVGDEIEMAPAYYDETVAGSSRGLTVYANATNIGFLVSSVGSLTICKRIAPVGDGASIANANWKAVLRAWT